MQVAAKKIVSIEYTLKDDDGNVVDSSKGGDPLVYLHGANNIIPGLEKSLEGKTSGEEVNVRIPPEEAYGMRDDAKVESVNKAMFGDENIKVGAQYHAAGPNNEHFVVTVVDVKDEMVTIDANHPLAGIHLNFDVKIVEVREATDDELSHGHAHGPGGHQHD